MSELKGYRCPNCDSMLPIPKYGRIFKCNCCGSEYEKIDEKEDLKPLKIEICPARLITLESKRSIPQEYLFNSEEKEKIVSLSIESMAYSLAEEIIPFMTVETYYDPIVMQHIIKGRVKISDNFN